MTTVKAYFKGDTEAEAKRNCEGFIGALDSDEIKEFKSICVFDRKGKGDFRCYTEIELKGEPENEK